VIVRLRIAALLAASFSLAACGGGGKSLTNVIPATGHAGAVAPAAHLRIVGVGDSLTAGVQSGGLMGTGLPVQGSNQTLGQIGPIQATQEHGFFALLWEQANGIDITAMSDPSQSPLPLMTPPGIGDLLAPTTSGFPYPITTECDSHQIAANTFSTALSLRENAALNPWDLGVPGQTVHEALYMTGATGSCSVSSTNSPAAAVNLNDLINGESQNIWPILAGFGQGVTQVQAAITLHAQVATVWLGSNDLLKIALSNGAAPVTSPSSMQADTASIIAQLKASGAKVAVANLVDVMGAAVFIPQPAYSATLTAYLTGALEAQGLPSGEAAALAGEYAPAYAAQETTAAGLGANGYFTINTLFATLQTAAAQIAAEQAPVAPVLTTNGDYVTDATANEVKSLNAAYNASIAAAASSNGAALVDIHTIFTNIETNGYPINQYCCSLAYGGGFFSLDGVHPSNTGYAVIANAFIDELNTAYSLGIPDVNVTTVYSTDPYAPGNGVGPNSRIRRAK
jgi:lysophospholipase L1-like esterase